MTLSSIPFLMVYSFGDDDGNGGAFAVVSYAAVFWALVATMLATNRTKSVRIYVRHEKNIISSHQLDGRLHVRIEF
jgi:hypothetical protein